MRFKSISSQELAVQKTFNSFILCQTKNIPTSQKFPFIVTTLKGKIRPLVQNDESYEEFEYNYSFDCVNYLINGKCVILGEGSWLRTLLNPKENNLLESYQIVNYEPLQTQKHLKFYFYHEKHQNFKQVYPKYLILGDTIVFQDVEHLEEALFKKINLAELDGLIKFTAQERKKFENEVYNFKCEYGIMSDMHFMGSFVRGSKPICSYLKKKDSNEYFHMIDETLLNNLKRLYPFSNL